MGRRKLSPLSAKELARIRQQQRRERMAVVALNVEISPSLMELLRNNHREGSWREFIANVLRKGLGK